MADGVWEEWQAPDAKGVELFRELKRVFPTAYAEDYFQHGVWLDELMDMDLELITRHREEIGAPEPPPLEDIPYPELPKFAATPRPAMALSGIRPGALSGVQPGAPIPPPGGATAGQGWLAARVPGKASITPVRPMRPVGALRPISALTMGKLTAVGGGPRPISSLTMGKLTAVGGGPRPISSLTMGKLTAIGGGTAGAAAQGAAETILDAVNQFVEYWGLDATKTRILIMKLPPTKRRAAMTNFSFDPSKGISVNAALSLYLQRNYLGTPAVSAAANGPVSAHAKLQATWQALKRPASAMAGAAQATFGQPATKRLALASTPGQKAIVPLRQQPAPSAWRPVGAVGRSSSAPTPITREAAAAAALRARASSFGPRPIGGPRPVGGLRPAWRPGPVIPAPVKRGW
eukprot:gnl/TRDRNA2_/TRDRNA2_86070_c0_seq1.p1 gnl/TRDRNA2_/TRDRNA2_86070_c0~~gnl/TRDRNA2_/TRDRNA2_86070_c0_seq1.p1  ORF type:complete len:405 (-),score=40.67 gnl/TRDRNA2_/TRDRNA2_86070_c0_seq1:65-1279(-)